MKASESPKHFICKAIALYLFLVLFTLPQISISQQLAFPTAYGGGAYASGGRGGSVSIVTNLNDNGPGSLRSFANVSNTTIVFNVSGVINLSSTLWLYGDNVTIAGQTAPQGGITIDGARVLFQNTDNLICRYIRFRGGYGENNDTVGGYYLNNVIFDHCSFSFGGDEAFSVIVDSPSETGGDITIQNCFLAESSTGGIMGGEEAPDNVTGISMIGNVFYNISHRFPNLNSNGRYDIINNYIHNHSKRMIRGNFAYRINELGNLYDYGNNRVWDKVLNHHGCNPGEDIPTIYAQGNTIIGNESQVSGETVSNTIPEMNANNRLMWKYFYDNNSSCGYGLKNRGDQLEADFFTNTQFPIIGRIPVIHNATDLKDIIVQDAGASKRLNSDGTFSNNNDVLDANWKAQIMAGNYIPEMAETVYSVPAIASVTRPNNYDSDNDGMADEWELSTFNTLSHNGTIDSNGNGYTDLEDFLNGVDGSSGDIIDVQSVAVNPSTAELEIIETIQLTTTFTPSNATNQNGVWSSSNQAIATVNATGLVTAVSTGDVTITFTSADGNFTDASEITVLPETIEANAGQDTSICQGESVTLTATGGSTYLWNTGATTASITVNPTITTTYTVTAYSASGNESDTDEVIVTVNTPPTANAGDDVSTCLGTAVTLTASGGGTYQWNTGATTQSITVNPNTTTTYSVEVTQNGCSSTDQVIVTVNPLTTINAGNNVTIISGDSATLTASGGVSYVWNTGATSQSITVNPTSTTTYTVTGSSANGCQNTDSVTVFVQNETVTANAGDDETICQGYGTTLTASGGNTYLWNTGATTQSITVNPNATSTYTVTVFSGNAQDSDDVTVFVNPNPNVVITNGDEVMILEGEFITLSATGANTYLWNNGATQPNIAVSPPNTTTYSVTGFINNCEDEREVQVNVLERVNAEIQGEQTVCLNESIVLTAVENTNAEYLWNTGETTQSITVSPTEDTEYSVTVYNALDYDIAEMMVSVNDCSVINPEEPEDFEFLVYPNPTSGVLNIKINGLLNVADIYLYDVSGKSIYHEKINEDEQQSFIKQLNVSNFASGLYFLKLVDDTNVITKKIIVN